MDNKNKKRLALLLLMFAFILSGVTYAYWASDVAGNNKSLNSTRVLVGTGQTVKTTVNLSETSATESKVLVPTGKKAFSTAGAGKEIVEKVTLQFEVKWKSDVPNAAQGTVGQLTFTNTAITIDGATTNNALVNVSKVEPMDIVADGSAVIVSVDVTLLEPETKEVYDAIAGKDIALTFEASVSLQ